MALVVIGVSLVAGLLLGLGWALIAPTVPCTVIEPGNCAHGYENGRFFIGEGLFATITAVAGVVAAVLARRWVRRLGWPVVVALAVGGCLASLVAWRFGVWVGPADPAAAGLPVGATAELTLRMRSSGLLLSGSITAVAAAFWIIMAADDRADPELAEPDPASSPER